MLGSLQLKTLARGCGTTNLVFFTFCFPDRITNIPDMPPQSDPDQVCLTRMANSKERRISSSSIPVPLPSADDGETVTEYAVQMTTSRCRMQRRPVIPVPRVHVCGSLEESPRHLELP